MRAALSVIVVATASLACSNSGNPVSATAPSVTGSTPASAAAAEAGGLQASNAAMLTGVKQATARFHDVDKAIAAGYLSPVGGHCEAVPSGTMGIHSANPALLGNQAIVAEQPEVLLYLPKPGGGVRLVGVEYLQVVLVRNTGTGEVGPWFPQAQWPAGYEVVNPAPTLFGQTFDGPMPGHTPDMPWHYDLHVWAWAPNPAGTFSPGNPALSCS